jgi:hypothetical protein
MRSDFAAFILTHGRPDRVHTYKTLMEAGYTGKVYFIVDDEDVTADAYRARFGEERVLTFSKAEAAKLFDIGDNFEGRRGVVYARNAAWGLARSVGLKHFIALDDDYTSLFYRYDSRGAYGSFRIRRTVDDLLEALVAFMEATPALTITISQGGDHIGGANDTLRLKRKAMNTFVCSVDRPFRFDGRINEDVNAYVMEARRGRCMFTLMQAQVNQLMTQSNAGGMTELYLDSGTYVKSFYSVMLEPSCVRIGQLADPRSPHWRFHHAINWRNAAVQIVHERHRKI